MSETKDSTGARNLGHEGLVASVNALRIAALEFHEEVPGAVHAVRRIIRSLHSPRYAHQYPEISAIGSILEETDDGSLEAVIQKYLPVLRGLIVPRNIKRMGILCIEDDEVAQQILEHRLKAANRFMCMAGTLAQAKQVLIENEISLILLDLSLPDGDGRDLLLQLRENPATAGIPIIVISSKQGQQAQTECLALGADNFIPKPINPTTISAVVGAELERAAETLRRSSQDQLTGLPNRKAFTNALMRSAQLASRSGQPLAVALLDIDRFKTVNDLYGHAMGDEVLQWLAFVVPQSLRGTDLLARWGEEFAVLLPGTDQASAHIALEKALAAFRAKQFTVKDGLTFQVSFSAGVTLVDTNAPIAQAMEEADRFLYKAKTAGRGLVLGLHDKEIAFRPTVLIVEDDAFTASTLQYCLEHHGFKTVYAQDGESALAAAATYPISLITLDVMLPGDIDGFELLRRFRKIKSVYHTPIVMVSSDVQQEDILRGFKSGADDYIKKPFSSRELLVRIDRLLKKQ